MAPPKAFAWPAYIFNDPAVETLDERGRFIVCGVCADYYATCGGKRPKPIVLNGCYRTRAWEVHKQRTRAHNPYQEESRLTPPPCIPVPVSTTTKPKSFGEALRWQPYEPQPLNQRYATERITEPTQSFNQPPLRDRRRSFSPPRSCLTLRPKSTWRRYHPVVPEPFERASLHQFQPKPRTRRMQPGPKMPSTMVFPLVRTPADLRRRSDSDPDWGDDNNDWRRLLSNSSSVSSSGSTGMH